MKRRWQVRRSMIECLEGQRRWDCAYQCLLQWVGEAASQANDNSPSSAQQEGQADESRHLRSCFNTATAKGTDH
jgi:hypothetical protein